MKVRPKWGRMKVEEIKKMMWDVFDEIKIEISVKVEAGVTMSCYCGAERQQFKMKLVVVIKSAPFLTVRGGLAQIIDCIWHCLKMAIAKEQ